MEQSGKGNSNQINCLNLDQIRNFTLDSFHELKKQPTMKKIIHFHTINKFLFIAFDQEKAKTLGNLVANGKKKDIFTLLNEYENTLDLILKSTPTKKRHINVLNKIFSHFYTDLHTSKVKHIDFVIKKYRNEEFDLADVLNIFENLTFDLDNTYVAKQTYYLLFSNKKPRMY